VASRHPLERLLAPLDPVPIADGAGLADAYENLVEERWVQSAGQRRLPPAALWVFYRVKRAIPRRAQLSARRMLIRWQGSPAFPRWPFDASVGDLLAQYARRCLDVSGSDELPFRWFWPDGHHAALILTHDVESAEGLRNAVEIADLEDARGMRSSFNIVGSWYTIDWGIVNELSSRGFELGVHGIYHDRSLFSGREEFERQLPMLVAFRDRLQASGFRSPATHRVIDWLAELPVEYDCTIPMSDPYEPQPGGCCSPWPFFLGDVVELPYTMPQDHTLFNLLKQRDISVWLRQLEAIEGSYGLVQCVTHPDPGYLGEPELRRRYTELLDAVAEREGLWRALPREVASWWRQRDDGAVPGEAPHAEDCPSGAFVSSEDDRTVEIRPPGAR
jgi:peptidoglycan/xylan/chitin deacetylase (PgdA/CDA1 family)